MFLQYNMCVPNVAYQIQYTYWWWGKGTLEIFLVAVLHSVNAVRLAVPPPPHSYASQPATLITPEYHWPDPRKLYSSGRGLNA